MKTALFLAVLVILVIWPAWNLWNLFRIATGLRNGAWRRPMWWTRLCSVSLCAGAGSWIWGFLSEGLGVRKECEYFHHQPFDGAYWDAHAEEFQRFFPLHTKCNARYDLVPAWVNPTVVICVVVALVAAAVLLWFGIARLTGLFRTVALQRGAQRVTFTSRLRPGSSLRKDSSI